MKKQKTNLKILIIWLLLLVIGTPYSISQSTDSSISVLNKTIDLAWTLSNKKPDSAMLIINRELNKKSIESNLQKKAELIRIKGILYFYKVDYVKALDYFIESKNISESINFKKGIASAKKNISLIYRVQGFYDKGLQMDLEILKMQKEIGDSVEIAGAYNNLAVSYQDKNELKIALKFYRKAVSYIINFNEKQALELYYNNIGNIFIKTNLYDSAFYYFSKSLSISKENNDKQMECNSLAYLGEYYSLTKNFKKSIFYYEKSLEIAKDIGIVYEINDVAERLYELYFRNNEYKKAYTTLLLAKSTADSANNIETMQKIIEFETAIKLKQEEELNKLNQERIAIQNTLNINKEKQLRNIAIIIGITFIVIAIIFFISARRKSIYNKRLIEQKDEIISQKEEIETQRDNIEELNKTKDKFFTIIAHDLRNPISGINKLTNNMCSEYNSLTKDELKNYISIINKSTLQANNLLENLLHWAMMQTNSIKTTPSEFNLNDVIIENISLLNNNAKLKSLTIVFENNQNNIVFADKEMISTTIRNIYNNAIKFSNNNGSIIFSINKENDFYKVSISDNGIGISEKDQKLLFNIRNSTKEIGKSSEKGTGLGLILCKEFIEFNKGSIGIISEINKGTTFYFTLPIHIRA